MRIMGSSPWSSRWAAWLWTRLWMGSIKPMELEVGGAAVDAAVEAAMADAGLRRYDTIVLKIGEEVYEFGVSWSLHTSRLPPASRLPVLSPPYPLRRL